jgi:hypothetical protein
MGLNRLESVVVKIVLFCPLAALCCCGTPLAAQLGASVTNAVGPGQVKTFDDKPTGVAQPLEYVYAAAPLSQFYIVDNTKEKKFATQISDPTQAVNYVSAAINDSMVRC